MRAWQARSLEGRGARPAGLRARALASPYGVRRRHALRPLGRRPRPPISRGSVSRPPTWWPGHCPRRARGDVAAGSPRRAGTRGSIARPGPSTLRHGGNTSCVEVTADDGTLVVLDCGTGAHELALDLRRPAAPAPRPPADQPHALGSHPGLPVLRAALRPGSEWDIYAPGASGRHLQETFAGQMSHEHHPVTLERPQGAMRFHDAHEGSFQIGPIRVRRSTCNHPALTLGYRLEADGSAPCVCERSRAARGASPDGAHRGARRPCTRGPPPRRLPRPAPIS